jgi:hypothetical protein
MSVVFIRLKYIMILRAELLDTVSLVQSAAVLCAAADAIVQCALRSVADPQPMGAW